MNPLRHRGKVTQPRYDDDAHRPLFIHVSGAGHRVVLGVNFCRAYLAPSVKITLNLGSYLIFDFLGFRNGV